MPTKLDTFLKYIMIAGLALVAFIPLFVSESLFFPFISGKGFAFRIIVEVAFAIWLVLILRERGTSVVHTDKSVIPHTNAVTIIVTIFTFVILIADLFGLNPVRSIWSNFERMEGWMTIIHLWAYFIMLSAVIKTKDHWKKFIDVVLIAGLITALYGLFQFFGWAETHQGSRVDASLGNSAYMAIYMLINAFLSAYLSVSYFSKKNHLFWTYAIFAAFFSFIMFQTATRGTILAWIAAIIISSFIYAVFGRKEKGQSNKSRALAGGAIGLVVLIGILFYFNRDAAWIQKNAVLVRIASISISDTKTQARGFIWPMAIKGIFESPKTAIIGIGQENFNYIFNSHYDSEMYAHEQWFDRAHSVFLDWLVAGGILGLLAYLALYVISLIYIWKSDLTVGQKSVLLGLLVGYTIHNIFVFDNQTSYVMFFTFLALIFSLRPSKACSWFKNYNKPVSEDANTIRDYIFTPLVIIGLIFSVYFVNIRAIRANKTLISALQACSNPSSVSVVPFEKALSFNQPVANQEIIEQTLTCSTGVIQSQAVDQQKKLDFYSLSKKVIESQIKATPNDARIYIIAGSFYNSVGDYASATPLLEKALELSPGKQSMMYELASNYFAIGKKKEAISVMEKAYLLAPENYIAKANYIAALISIGADAEVQRIFPNEKEIFNDNRIINAYVLSKQYNKAIAIYKNIIAASTESADVYSALAYVYLLNGQNYLAIETLTAAIKKFPLMKSQIEGVIKQIQEGKLKV